MAKVASLKVFRAKALREKLNALPDLAKKRVVVALLAGGEDVASLARELVPKKEHILERSIRVAFTESKSGGSDQNTVVVGPSGEFLVANGRIKNLPRWVEFGTQAQKKGQRVVSLGKRGKTRQRISQGDHDATAAKPFLFPAWMAKKKGVRSRVAKAVNTAMKDAAKMKVSDNG